MNHVLMGAGAVVFSAVRWIGIARCCKAAKVCVADLNVRWKKDGGTFESRLSALKPIS